MKKTLITKNSFTKNPKDLFTCIESNYSFGRPGTKYSEIRPYFLITDGTDIVIFDNGARRASGLSLSFEKRPSFFSCRFWNRGPKQFSDMITSFVGTAFMSITDLGENISTLQDINVIETLTAMYSLDRQHVLPVYIVKLPHDRPLKMKFNLPGSVSTIGVDDFIQLAIVGAGQFDTISTAIAYLIGTNTIIFPRHEEENNKNE